MIFHIFEFITDICVASVHWIFYMQMFPAQNVGFSIFGSDQSLEVDSYVQLVNQTGSILNRNHIYKR